MRLRPWDWGLRQLYRAIQLAVLVFLILFLLSLVGRAPAHDFAPHYSIYTPPRR
jgi:hypothetical protein